MSNYISGQNILEQSHITINELLSHIKMGLHPYSEDGKPINCRYEYTLQKRLKVVDAAIERLSNNKLSSWERIQMDGQDLEGPIFNLQNERTDIADRLNSIEVEDGHRSWKYFYPPRSATERDSVYELLKGSFFLETEVSKYVEIKDVDRVETSINSDKVRPSREHREDVRKVASELWEKNPTMTIVAVIDDLNERGIGKKLNGNLYLENTIRRWINDLCPDRSPGRRPKKK